MYLMNGRAGIIDLASGETSEEQLDEELVVRGPSAVTVAEGLQASHGEDSVVLGTGLLTGSLIPAASAGVFLGRKDKGRRFAPLLGFAGVELKLTGFDFVVLKGAAAKPGYLWVRDGIIEFVAAPEMEGIDSWQRTDRIRSAQGDQRIQVLSTGKWAAVPGAKSQFVVNHWGGEDKHGLATDLAGKNVLAVALRGMGELEVSDPEGHFGACATMIKEHFGRLGRSEGLESYSKVADRDDFRSLVHRVVGCYGCPFPCRSFLKVHEDPKEMRLVNESPGYLHHDIPALEGMFSAGLNARDATIALASCAKAGAEPLAVLSALGSESVTIGSVDKILSGGAAEGTSPSAVENFEASFDDRERYIECLGLGLCPRYWAKAGYDRKVIVETAEPALGKPFSK
jgi:aldehyde:ferredoxin oxidoreductase